MKTSRKMQAVITQLAQKHGLDLTAAEGYLRLDMPGFDRLVIEKIGESLVKVAHYYEPASPADKQHGHLMADPEMAFFMAHTLWVPFEIRQVIGGQRVYARPTPDGQGIVLIDPKRQEDIADFAEIWASNIETQGWLENGVKWDPCDPANSEPPDLNTMMEWLDEGVAEATDGCIVESDGVCPHACQSWLLVLGYI
jgi:hypothetical protein